MTEEQQRFCCINCGRSVTELYIQYSPGNIRLTKCDKCKAVADPYIECEFMIILIDLILHKTKAYRHLLFNMLNVGAGDAKHLVMEFESSKIEERLRSLLLQLHVEVGVLDRMVYKNKNQHRRGTYFQYLLKVRRDMRLLMSAELGEILKVLFPIINGKKPAQYAYFSSRSKKKRCAANHNFHDRLLGVARLLSQTGEPIIKAAIQISLLLAKSFFTGFSITILALLARLRVLVQQILLDVIEVFNKVSSLSQEKQSMKLAQDGIEVFREYYPPTRNALRLACIWKADKFVLVEHRENIDENNQDKDLEASPLTMPVNYDTLNLFSEASKEEDSPKHLETDLPTIGLQLATQSSTHQPSIGVSHGKPETRVAFVAVRKVPPGTDAKQPSKKIKWDLPSNDIAEKGDQKGDPFYELLTSGSRPEGSRI